MIDEALRHLVVEAVAEATRPLVAELRQLREAVAFSRSRWVPRGEASTVLGVSLDTIDRRIADGSIRSRRLGRAVRVLLELPPRDDDIARLSEEARA